LGNHIISNNFHRLFPNPPQQPLKNAKGSHSFHGHRPWSIVHRRFSIPSPGNSRPHPALSQLMLGEGSKSLLPANAGRRVRDEGGDTGVNGQTGDVHLGGGVMVQFPKAAEKFPPPRFSVPQIPLESIGYIIGNGPSRGRRICFFSQVKKVPRTNMKAFRKISILPVWKPGAAACYPIPRLLDKMNPPAASARRGCWISRPGTGS
jgi:hypothetical protein